ncbi:hypothetical protein SAMN05660841_01690 [Sphingobacterium nematocida]|uniref:Uncharacterized protein n=1 Tax=Sphingobacterium nematocida TaxID=1513896 RepID=A0A1T5CZR1_9SPHI|nr:hypothetical protein [Sphingobacterium nematocida]SKB64972.1 hypothetical protein SAMN05660841_01690 [Sphingobacterium nematocida]
MIVFILILKYLLCIPTIAYLITANKKFFLFQEIIASEKFFTLYKPTLVLVSCYLLVIELVYYLFKKRYTAIDKPTPGWRKIVQYIFIALFIVTTFNLVLLDYALSEKDETLISTGYLKSGLFFFLITFFLYAISVWFRPKYSLGYWLHQFAVAKIMDRIMHRNDSEQVLIAAAENNDNLRLLVQVEEVLKLPEVDTYKEGEDSNITPATINGLSDVILMDILLVISSRKGIYLYLRSGQCIFVSKKMKDLFTKEQLVWLVSYQKGARVNLIHLVANVGHSIDSLWSSNTYNHFMDGIEKSLFELADMLKMTSTFQENIAQQILHREKLDKTVLSRKVF